MTDQAGQQLVPMKGCLAGTFSRIMGLLHGAKVRADGDLHHVVKAQDAHGGLDLGGGGLLAELAHEGRRHAGNDLLLLPCA